MEHDKCNKTNGNEAKQTASGFQMKRVVIWAVRLVGVSMALFFFYGALVFGTGEEQLGAFADIFCLLFGGGCLAAIIDI